MTTKPKNEPTPTDEQLKEVIRVKAPTDPGYAIAWALTELVHAQWATARAIDALGLNELADEGEQGEQGVGQLIAIQLMRIAEMIAARSGTTH